MPIGPITSLAAGALGNVGEVGTSSRTARPAAGADFGSSLVGALDELEATQDHADRLAVRAATGDLTDVHDYMIAATEAALQTEMTVAIRNRAIDAFNEIMRMPV